MREYYGDNVRWFVADVIDSTPPYGLEGRIRVRVHGIHSPSTKDIAQANLPWAQVVIPSTEGGVSGLGANPVIQAGSLVFGFFMDGANSQVPLVLGSLPRVEYPSRIQQSIEFEDVIERANPTEDFYNKSIVAIEDDIDQNDNYDLGVFTKESTRRKAIAVKFFVANGFTIKQACALSAGLYLISRMDNGFTDASGRYGIGGWKGQRQKNLRIFNERWDEFTIQLAFVLYELNTTRSDAGSRLRRVDTLSPGNNNCQTIVAKYYFDWRTTKEISPVVANAQELFDDLVG